MAVVRLQKAHLTNQPPRYVIEINDLRHTIQLFTNVNDAMISRIKDMQQQLPQLPNQP